MQIIFNSYEEMMDFMEKFRGVRRQRKRRQLQPRKR